MTGLGRNIFQTLGHKLTGTNLGRGILATGAVYGGVKAGQSAGVLPLGSVLDLARLTPGIVANQVDRFGRAVGSIVGPATNTNPTLTAPATPTAHATFSGRLMNTFFPSLATPAQPAPVTPSPAATVVPSASGNAIPMLAAAALGAFLLLK